ncbi:hypothetical protein BOTBODRAFT_49817, partial [Botryobasidium botryosum FD-172 SS1]
AEVLLPAQDAIWKEITQVFNNHLTKLGKLFNGPSIVGCISSTLDCWTAENDNAYLALTLHWIEEVIANVFELKSDLGAFIHLPYSHTGMRLRQVIYCAFMRVKAKDKAKSSPKRKHTWLEIQRHAQPDITPKMLKIDSATRWSSTQDMIARAHTLCKAVAHDLEKEKKFVEVDKLMELQLTQDKWKHIECFLELLDLF